MVPFQRDFAVLFLLIHSVPLSPFSWAGKISTAWKGKMQKAWGIRKGFLESRTRDVNEKEKRIQSMGRANQECLRKIWGSFEGTPLWWEIMVDSYTSFWASLGGCLVSKLKSPRGRLYREILDHKPFHCKTRAVSQSITFVKDLSWLFVQKPSHTSCFEEVPQTRWRWEVTSMGS